MTQNIFTAMAEQVRAALTSLYPDLPADPHVDVYSLGPVQLSAVVVNLGDEQVGDCLGWGGLADGVEIEQARRRLFATCINGVHLNRVGANVTVADLDVRRPGGGRDVVAIIEPVSDIIPTGAG